MQFLLLSRTFAVPTPMALGTAELQCTTAIISWEIFVYFKSCYSLNSVGHCSQHSSKEGCNVLLLFYRFKKNNDNKSIGFLTYLNFRIETTKIFKPLVHLKGSHCAQVFLLFFSRTQCFSFLIGK